MDDVAHPNGENPDGNRPPSAPPIGDTGQDAEIVRPKAIDTAFQLSVAATVIGAIATVVTMLFDRAWLVQLTRETLAQADMPDSAADVDRMVGMFQVALGLGVLAYLALFVLFAVKMRAGRNWARVLLAVVAAVNGVNFLSAMATAGAELDLMWTLADAAFAIAAVVYMFRPESTKYFAAHKERKMRRHQR